MSALEGEDLFALAERVAAQSDAATVDGPVWRPDDSDREVDVWLSLDDAAALLNISDAVLHNRLDSGALLSFEDDEGRPLIPAAQIIDGRAVAGLRDIVEWFDGDRRRAWRFLSDAIFYGDADPRPIDKLRRAAASQSADDTREASALIKSAQTSYAYGDFS